MSKHLYMCKEYCLCFLVVFDLHVVINIYQYIIISFSFIFFLFLKYIIKVLGSMPH